MLSPLFSSLLYRVYQVYFIIELALEMLSCLQQHEWVLSCLFYLNSFMNQCTWYVSSQHPCQRCSHDFRQTRNIHRQPLVFSCCRDSIVLFWCVMTSLPPCQRSVSFLLRSLRASGLSCWFSSFPVFYPPLNNHDIAYTYISVTTLCFHRTMVRGKLLYSTSCKSYSHHLSTM